jgi:perosamine synthetase
MNLVTNDFYVPYILKGSRYGKEEMDVLQEILLNDKTLSCGMQRDLFENEFAKLIDTKYAFTLTSCTTALEFAAYLMGLKNGDEIIATPFTYQASIQHLLTLPVKVKFCDIDPNSLGIDINSVKNLISEKTKCMYITHYGGYMNEMNKLMDIAKKHGIYVVEDCAHALGSKYFSSFAGTTADIGCFSFHSSKNISTLGEGGMITFKNDTWAEIVRNIRNNEPDCIFEKKDIHFGNYKKENLKLLTHEKNAFTEDCKAIFHCGTNSTLNEAACAVGRCQLKKLNDFNSERKKIAEYFNQKIGEMSEFRIQKVPEYIGHTYHLYSFFIHKNSGISRNDFVSYLYNQKIEIVLRYFPLHLLPEWRYRGAKYGQCPTTERIWFEELVNLPCYPGITEEQLNYIIDKIKAGVLKCQEKKKVYCS